MTAIALQLRIDTSIKNAYPDGHLASLRIDALDSYWDNDDISILKATLGECIGATMEYELTHEADRCYVFYFSSHDSASWITFNRELNENERLESIKHEPLGFVFEILRVSRIGPFWTSYWNRFTIEQERVAPTILWSPPSWEWHRIHDQIVSVTSDQGLFNIPKELLDQRIPYISVHRPQSAWAIEEASIWDALFGDGS